MENEQTPVVATNEQDYIDQIKKLKENSVSKEQYDKILGENKKLIESLVNGDKIEAKQEVKANVDELRDKLFNKDLSNLEFAETALELREQLIERGEGDPFLPSGSKIAPTIQDEECANRVAEALKSCVEYAAGDSNIFTQELQRITIDTSPVLARRRY